MAERIVSNELEFRGFRVSDLNREGTSANADLLAARDGRTWQIQVKGATEENGWWVQYGYCNDAIIAGEEPMFNRCSGSSFYKAEIVVLVSVKSPKEYTCVVLPVEIAEEAAQINLSRDYRIARNDGRAKKPGKVWVALDWIPSSKNAIKKALNEKEVELLKLHKENWNIFDEASI